MHFKAALSLTSHTSQHSLEWEAGDVVIVSGYEFQDLISSLGDIEDDLTRFLNPLGFFRCFQTEARLSPFWLSPDRSRLDSPFLDYDWKSSPFFARHLGELFRGMAHVKAVGEGTPASPLVTPIGFVDLPVSEGTVSSRAYGYVDVRIGQYSYAVLVDVAAAKDRVERLIRCSEWCLTVDLRSGPIIILDADLHPVPAPEYRPLAATVLALSEFWRGLRERVRMVNSWPHVHGLLDFSYGECVMSATVLGSRLLRDFLGLPEEMLEFESGLLLAAQVAAANALGESEGPPPMVFGSVSPVFPGDESSHARLDTLAKILRYLPDALNHALIGPHREVTVPAVILFTNGADDCRKLLGELKHGFDASKTDFGDVSVWRMRRRHASTPKVAPRQRSEPPGLTDARATTPWTGVIAVADGNKAQQPAWFASGLIRKQHAGQSERNGLEMALSVHVPRQLGSLLGHIRQNPGDSSWREHVEQLRSLSKQGLSTAPIAYQRPRSVALYSGRRAPQPTATSRTFEVRILGVTGNALDACVCGVRTDTQEFVRLGNQPTGKFIGDALAHFRKGLLVRVTASQVQGRGPFQEAWLLESSEPLSTDVESGALPTWLLDAGVVERCAPEALFDSGLTIKDHDLCLSEWGYENTYNTLCVWQPPAGVSLRRKWTNDGEFYELAVRGHVVRLRNLSLDPGPEVLDHRHLLGLTITQRGMVRLGGWYALT